MVRAPESRRRALRRGGPLCLLALLLLGGTLFAVPGFAATASRAAFRGKTAQGLTVHLGRHFSYGRTFRYQATLNCSDGTTFTEGVFSDDVRVRHHRFHSRFVSHRGAMKTKVSGRLQGRKASGQLRIVEHYSATPGPRGNLPLSRRGPVTCDSGQVAWTAQR